MPLHAYGTGWWQEHATPHAGQRATCFTAPRSGAAARTHAPGTMVLMASAWPGAWSVVCDVPAKKSMTSVDLAYLPDLSSSLTNVCNAARRSCGMRRGSAGTFNNGEARARPRTHGPTGDTAHAHPRLHARSSWHCQGARLALAASTSPRVYTGPRTPRECPHVEPRVRAVVRRAYAGWLAAPDTLTRTKVGIKLSDSTR